MATHSSILAWRIPGTEEPGGLPSRGSHRVGNDWSHLAAAAVVCINQCYSLNPSHPLLPLLCPQVHSLPLYSSLQIGSSVPFFKILYICIMTQNPTTGHIPWENYKLKKHITLMFAEHSPLHQWKASGGGHLHFKERTFSKSANTFNNRMWCLFLNWWHVTTLRWTDVTMDIMWLFILILTWFSDYFALHL